MVKIGVRLPRRIDDAGEYLADARALDAAGVDSLWLDDEGHEPWLVLAGIAAVTGSARLVVPVSVVDARAPEVLAARLATLQRLSRGRVVLGVADTDALEHVLHIAREATCRTLFEATDERRAALAARAADGVVGIDVSPDRARAWLTSTLELRRREGVADPFELWTRAAMPEDPVQWRELRRTYEDAGATGLILPADPRLLDMLRNGDEEDDRSDLQLAQG